MSNKYTDKDQRDVQRDLDQTYGNTNWARAGHLLHLGYKRPVDTTNNEQDALKDNDDNNCQRDTSNGDYVLGPYVTDTIGCGWCVRIDGTDIFEGPTLCGQKNQVTLEIARGLNSRLEAEAYLTDWLSKQYPPSPPKQSAPNRNDPDVGETWYVKLKHASTCFTCIVTEVTEMTVVIRDISYYHENRYKRSDIEFVELTTNN